MKSRVAGCDLGKASASFVIATVGEDGLVRIWDAETGEGLLAFLGHNEGVSGGLFRGTVDVSYSPDGSRLATAGRQGDKQDCPENFHP